MRRRGAMRKSSSNFFFDHPLSLDGTAGDPMTPPASLDDPEQIRSTQTSFIALEETINDSTNLHSTVVEKSEKEHSVGAKSGPKAAAKN